MSDGLTTEVRIARNIAFGKCWSALGQSLVYMSFMHPMVDWGVQRKRVYGLCAEFASTSEDNRKDEAYYIDLLERIEDEVENQC